MAPPRRTHALLDDAGLLEDAYRSGQSIHDLAGQVAASPATVRRALIRHGIPRLPRNRNRRPPEARQLDDGDWLLGQYRTRTGVEIAGELGVSPRTVYAAMERHGIARRSSPGQLSLQRPELVDARWLSVAVEQRSSTAVADELDVSAGTVTTAYRRAGIDPASTGQLFARGRLRPRPSAAALRAAWESEGTFRGVGRRFGVAHSTAAVWLAEVGVFLDPAPALSRDALLDAIEAGCSMKAIAVSLEVSVTTVRVELHRHGLFEAHRNRHRLVRS